MKTIAFYSYKGGVGRTLALSNIAKRLVEFGKSVCMIDFDLEAPGLCYKFKRNIDQNVCKFGIIDYIHEFSTNKNLVSKITPDYYYDLSRSDFMNKNKSKSFTLIPAGNTDNPDYWKKLSGINWHKLFYKKDAKGIPFFLDLKAKIERDLQPDYLLIDTRTGITEISSITLSILADQIVFLAANNEENIRGCQRVIRSILQPENNLLGIDKDIILTLTRLPYSEEPYERRKEIWAKEYFFSQFLFIKEQFNKDVQEVIVIHSDRELEFKEEFKIGYNFDSENFKCFEKNKSLIGEEYLKLFNRITEKDFTIKEKEQFYKIKKAERIYNEAINENDSDKSIELIKEAIELNPNESIYHFKLSLLYEQEDKYKEALNAIEKAVKITNSPQYHIKKGDFYYKLNEFEKALAEFENYKSHLKPYSYLSYVMTKKELQQLSEKELIRECDLFIETFPKSSISYNTRSRIYRLQKNYNAALKDIYKAIELDGERIPVYYATLAEIRFSMHDVDEFYVNIEIALMLKLHPDSIFDNETKDIYPHLFNEDRFRNLLEKYGYIDALYKIEEILSKPK